MRGTVDSTVALTSAYERHMPRGIAQIETAQNTDFSIFVTFLLLSVQHGEIPS